MWGIYSAANPLQMPEINFPRNSFINVFAGDLAFVHGRRGGAMEKKNVKKQDFKTNSPVMIFKYLDFLSSLEFDLNCHYPTGRNTIQAHIR